jgi:hypothetical protein
MKELKKKLNYTASHFVRQQSSTLTEMSQVHVEQKAMT